MSLTLHSIVDPNHQIVIDVPELQTGSAVKIEITLDQNQPQTPEMVTDFESFWGRSSLNQRRTPVEIDAQLRRDRDEWED